MVPRDTGKRALDILTQTFKLLTPAGLMRSRMDFKGSRIRQSIKHQIKHTATIFWSLYIHGQPVGRNKAEQ
jgi:hypothetical protein